ncbi:hypothetical protein PHYBOEH_010706 [Phytophthora boehmeriae]|uniref:Uncharacterized protein n=1 Tax=Phytophthora boehmeriae TaxID=109152 RepID=A0A8T1WXQ5_9STRA|nr:hypothetical protein PHYBOEH_010706 [Phytophthora boehmeriae]
MEQPPPHFYTSRSTGSGCADGYAMFTLTKVLNAWKRLQVSYYGGKYSIHRVLALEAYTRKATLLRVLIVSFGTPVPIIAFVLAQESIPLQNPTEGWRINYGFWIRAALLAFVVAHTLTNQATYLIDGVSISIGQLAMISTCASAMFTACSMVITPHLIFPVPFFVLTMAPLFYVCLSVSFRVVLGHQVLREMLSHRSQFVRYVAFIGTQNVVVLAYPAYETLFRYAQGSRYQLPVILLLPVIKVAVKNVVLRCTTHMEDMMPEAVIFSVDFFNAFYVATCMQSATSAAAIMALTLADLSQAVVMLYCVHYRTVTTLTRLHQTVANAPESDDLVTELCLLCRDPDKFERQTRARIRVRSCLPHDLSASDRNLLETLDTMNSASNSPAWAETVQVTGNKRSIYRKIRSICCRNRVDTIHPIVHVAVKQADPDIVSAAQSFKHRSTKHPSILRESLETLFTIECLVVTAYLEAVIPLLYCCYVLVMVHLPSARYHSEMTGVMKENVGATTFPVFVFGLLQILSFALLLLVIKRNCKMQALYHLAFVLETQMQLIQGVDFTFRFDLST